MASQAKRSRSATDHRVLRQQRKLRRRRARQLIREGIELYFSKNDTSATYSSGASSVLVYCECRSGGLCIGDEECRGAAELMALQGEMELTDVLLEDVDVDLYILATEDTELDHA